MHASHKGLLCPPGQSQKHGGTPELAGPGFHLLVAQPECVRQFLGIEGTDVTDQLSYFLELNPN